MASVELKILATDRACELATGFNTAIQIVFCDDPQGASTLDILSACVAIFAAYISQVPEPEREDYLQAFCDGVRNEWAGGMVVTNTN